MFYDVGVISNHNNNWYNQKKDNQPVFTVTPSSDGTTLSLSETSLYSFFADGTSFIDSYKFNGDFCVEVEIVSNTSNNCYFTIMSNKNPQITLNGAGIYKLILNGTTITKYKDGEVIGTTIDVTPQPVATGFRIENNGTLKYKNFIIYFI